MRWKQFFTPVQSIDSEKAKHFIDEHPHGSVTILDVRQPGEYQGGHLPGAKLIPLPDLGERVNELDPAKPTVVYCAIGGRSRVAAQMLAGKNFREVYNLSGGYKAWQGGSAIGAEDLGLELFTGRESVDEILLVAYSLERGLQDFYLSMIPAVQDQQAKELFTKLSAIEIKHQDRLFAEYCRVTATSPDRSYFDKKVNGSVMEGGLTTEEFLRLYSYDPESTADITGLAMAIEAQALDLYHRTAEKTPDAEGRRVLTQIAQEEQAHLKLLGDLLQHME